MKVGETATVASNVVWEGSWDCNELVVSHNKCEVEVTEEGDIPVRGGLHVHYWVYGQVNSSSANGGVPVVTLHGGPSVPHGYLLPLKYLACSGHPVVFYDQAGCGESRATPPSDGEDDYDELQTYPWLIDPSYYATEELPALLDHLFSSSPFFDESVGYHLLGHSWGTILAQLFVLDYYNKDKDEEGTSPPLRSMVLAGPLSDAQLYIQSQWDEDKGSLGSLPPFVQGRIRALEDLGAYGSDEYAAIDEALTGFFTIRTLPPPRCFAEAFQIVNHRIYTAMQGPSEFTIGGTLEFFNSTSRLHEIDLPVLLTSGKFDTMRPAVVRTMHDRLPLSEWIFLEKSAHCSMIDEPDTMMNAIVDFFNRAETTDTFVPKMGPSLDHSQETTRRDVATMNTWMEETVGRNLGTPTNSLLVVTLCCSVFINILFVLSKGNVFQRHRGYENLP